jgi:hypothetical protein
MTGDLQSTRSRREFSVGVGVVSIFLVGLAGCSSGSVSSTNTTRSTAKTVPTLGSHHPTGVSSHLVLPSDELRSGLNEQGVVVIDNDSGRPVSAGCLRIEVQLVSTEMPLQLHPTPSCPPGTLSPGITRLPFTLKAYQTVCLVPDGAIGDPGDCKPLPPGTYRTQLLPGLNIPDPPAVTVRVVAGS